MTWQVGKSAGNMRHLSPAIPEALRNEAAWLPRPPVPSFLRGLPREKWGQRLP